MTYDLRREAWIPWRRRSGVVEWGPPELLLDDLDGDCVTGVATPRPDFDGALQEFLVGLLSTALLPVDDETWEDLARQPPTPSEFADALSRLPSAFDLDGEGPRFFQDVSEADLMEGKLWTVESLLIGMPNTELVSAAGRTVVNDVFVKPGRIERLGRATAALALLTMQTYAPAGGAGHRTSLRGGGPLTTLVDPRTDSGGRSVGHREPLWKKLWANVETEQALKEKPSSVPVRALEHAFPWLRPTRTSNPKAGGAETPPSATHPLESYFGLPRRIRLVFDDAGRCDLTEREDERTVVGFWMRNYGAQYVGWQHPLTPHYRQKISSAEWLPMHGQPGGISWRDWVGLTLLAGGDGLRRPAAVVPAFSRREGPRAARAVRLHVFGYDMDNMKARGWTESSVPLFTVPDDGRRQLMRQNAEQLAEATSIAASALLYAVKTARFENPKEMAGDVGHVRMELWESTEALFYQVMARLADPEAIEIEASVDELRSGFLGALRDWTLVVFDRWCPARGLASGPLRRRVAARHDLSGALNGYTKLGEQLFTALGIPLPGGGRAARAAVKRSRKEATT